jgi:hypothetical protein
MPKLISLDISQGGTWNPASDLKFRNSGASTMAAPSADLVQALMGFP